MTPGTGGSQGRKVIRGSLDPDGEKCHLSFHQPLPENQRPPQSPMPTALSDVGSARDLPATETQIHLRHCRHRRLEMSRSPQVQYCSSDSIGCWPYH